jgi:hypothetical protein
MQLHLIRYSITHEGDARYVDGLFAPEGQQDDPQEFVKFRLAISPEGHPRLPEALIDALTTLRGVAAAEREKTKNLGPFDW